MRSDCLFNHIFLGVFDYCENDPASLRSRFLCIFTILCSKKCKKCKKMKKKCKKLQKNLHISKICCNFAPSFQMRERGNPKK